jgi:hypothetical protein
MPFKTHKYSIEPNVKAKCVFALSSFYMILLYTKMWLSWLQKYKYSQIEPIVYIIFVVVYVKMA